MPTITFDYNDFIHLLGKKIPKEEVIEKLPMIGADLETIKGDMLSIEFFPNRPDLTSVEGIARAARAFFGIKTGLEIYKTKPSNITLTVDPLVKSVRPFVTTALVKDVNMSEELLLSLMDMQEKLHVGIGRNRKKVAIGIHNFQPLVPPFYYKAVKPDSVSFVPLTKTESMTLQEILKSHEKGMEYAHLVQEYEYYPLIVDSKQNVLSFPPIINGDLTEVKTSTRDVFIDVTGTDRKAIDTALNIVTTALAERGGQIYTTTVNDDGKIITSPNLKPYECILSADAVNRILGLTLQDQEITQCLQKMGYNTLLEKKGAIRVFVPTWRSDILHEVDLIEDVAIGYGFDRFIADLPKMLTFGKTLHKQPLFKVLRQILIGLGFNEVTTFTISNEKNEFFNLGLKKSGCVQIENPIGEEYSCLRVGLLSSLLIILKENKHHPLPQQIFELGVVVDEQGKNHDHLAAVAIDAKASFTLCKSYVEAVLRNIDCIVTIHEGTHPAFIPGRCAIVKHKDTTVGIFGELHPQTITAFQLEHPIIAWEFFVNQLHP